MVAFVSFFACFNEREEVKGEFPVLCFVAVIEEERNDVLCGAVVDGACKVDKEGEEKWDCSGFIKPRTIVLSFFFVVREEMQSSISLNVERTRSMDVKYFDSAISNGSSSSIVVTGVAVEVGEGEEKSSLSFFERSKRSLTSSSILGGESFG